MNLEATTWKDDPLWYKDAIIYQLHVKAFFDSNNDGFGDFRGLTDKLDYIHSLGVNTIWLLPFYPSPMKDDGYDIGDYRDVHPDYGLLRDFKIFVRAAHRRGLKVVTELVINHTSDQHAWFQAARRAPRGSAARKFYVWSDDDNRFPETRIIFTDTESSNWAWDPVAKQYYWHRFFSHQPDLNHNNPQVVKAVTRVMRFWLDMGVDGLRLDAIPYLCVREGTSNENLPETHDVIKRMRAAVDERYENRMFLAEANQWPEDVRDYFGEGDECHMAYHFPLMPRMYMAVAQEDRHPITEIMGQTPQIPENCQWAIFLRNHDELTLEMVTDRERDYMYQTYATETRMRVNVGIRRRLAPLMDNDPGKIKLMNSLLMSMPGSPIIYYGDEIGMGDNFFLGDRNGVRTPMQWSPDRNAGFSKADPQRLYLPPIMDPVYGYDAVNVEAQSRDASSLLNWMKRLIAVRKSSRSFGRGTLSFLRPGNRKILAYVREYEDDVILCVANLSRTAQPVELDLGRFKGRIPVELMGHSVFPPIGELPYLLTLHAYDIYWFRITAEAEVPEWHEEYLPPMELPVLVLFSGWQSLFPATVDRHRQQAARNLQVQLEQELIPEFLPAQRWFGIKGAPIESVHFRQKQIWSTEKGEWLMGWIDVAAEGHGTIRYFLPLTIAWEDEHEDIWPLLHFTLAKVRYKARVGLLCDAFVDEHFAPALVSAMARQQEIPFDGGRLRFSATSAFSAMTKELPEKLVVRRPKTEGSNTAVILGDHLFLKGYRRLGEGVNPEIEIGRFLTEVSPFPNAMPVLGALEYLGPDGETVSLAVLQPYVKNQGDAWNYTLAYLERYLEECLLQPEQDGGQPHAAELVHIHTLGKRTGELHQALARAMGDAAFDPEPMPARELDEWIEHLRSEVLRTLDLLDNRFETLPERIRPDAAQLLEMKSAMLERVDSLTPSGATLFKTRHHGDYHLGQVLVVENDFVIIDFEGEPARPVAERRQKASPLRDVAGMLRSFSYVAYAALFRETIESPENFDVLEPFALDWERTAARIFLEGYEEGAEGSPAYPAEPSQAKALLELYAMEKALYELRYELDNRPDWIGIPIKGLVAFLQGGQEHP
ncbi:maltose alpha-D-glucosyltransferase [Thiohalomonas denitrificans]|uniref:maltose alpha-D-glucosyltransferase n=1 Tax=Thiohalomonas denitrificans TaxID=415747 RepID=UPI0026F24914|nr:maltose alpha-D-glucosyltransferase [Thiohalomonas denitrificans]